jgi:hypothetical protein
MMLLFQGVSSFKCSEINIVGGVFNIWVASEDLVFNTAGAGLDLEESLHSPCGSPWVSAEPVVSAILVTETENLDGVTASNIWGGGWIDTWLVVEEVSVDGESTFNWTVGEDFRLDLISWSGVSDGAINTLVFLEWLSISALGGASGGLTWTSLVRFALVSDNSSLVEIFPGHIHITTIATIVVGVTADHILRWEDNVDLVVWGNSESVWEWFGGTESPAWTALLLISNGVDWLWPLGSWIEVGWDWNNWGAWVHFVGWDDVGTALGKELLLGEILEWVGVSLVWLPEGSLWLDVSNHLFADGVSGSGESGNSANDDELEHVVWDLIN